MESTSSESDDDDESTEDHPHPANETDRAEEIKTAFSAIRCAAHTVQLAVHDTLKSNNMKKQIATLKTFVKGLRKMPYKQLLKSAKIRKPVLNCETRWNSTYEMARSLLENKVFICNMTKNDKICRLTEKEWEFVENFVRAFKPVATLTSSLQSAQLTLGDFYLLWMRCKLTLELQKDPTSLKLLEHTVKREPMLLENKALLAACFVDQRINYRESPIFKDPQRSIALVIDQINFY